MLQVRGLSKIFGGVIAADDISLTVNQLETHAVIGPNGAGKTTLVSQLAGNIRPDRGTIRFKDRDITAVPVHRRSLLGLGRSFQVTSLLMTMTVFDNVALAVQAHHGHSFRFWRPAEQDQTVRRQALAALDETALAARAGDPVSTLSHGERRQLEIAVALATGAEFLLLDEPMAGMAAEESARMVETLKNLKKTKTILLVEHDMDAVFTLADRISVLVYGRVIACGSPSEIRADDNVRRAYLGEMDA